MGFLSSVEKFKVQGSKFNGHLRCPTLDSSAAPLSTNDNLEDFPGGLNFEL
jgi:hypothetical protein